jgi:hypothetical protein
MWWDLSLKTYLGLIMDFLVDGQISFFCLDQHEGTSMRVDEHFT